MNMTLKRLFSLSILFLMMSCSAPGGNENTSISIKTTLGDIMIRLYDGTPIHRDNFIKLVRSGFYDGISFHRVINNFMIQAGDPKTRNSGAGLADSLGTYTIPAEFRNEYFHKKGALAAAREGNDVNPEMRSSGTQFYIVQGTKFTDEEISQADQRMNSNIKQSLFTKLLKEAADSALATGRPLSSVEAQEIASIRMYNYLSGHQDYKTPEERRNAYTSSGGVPRLDGTYTVFGEVIEGLEIIDKIAAVKTDESDKPISEVRILKMKISRK